MSENYGHVDFSDKGPDGNNLHTYESRVTAPNHTFSTLAVGLVPGALSASYSHTVLSENDEHLRQIINDSSEHLCLTAKDELDPICAADYYDEGLIGVSIIAGALVTNVASGISAKLMGHSTTTIKHHTYRKFDLGSIFSKSLSVIKKPFKAKDNQTKQDYKVGFDLRPKN